MNEQVPLQGTQSTLTSRLARRLVGMDPFTAMLLLFRRPSLVTSIIPAAAFLITQQEPLFAMFAQEAGVDRDRVVESYRIVSIKPQRHYLRRTRYNVYYVAALWSNWSPITRSLPIAGPI